MRVAVLSSLFVWSFSVLQFSNQNMELDLRGMALLGLIIVLLAVVAAIIVLNNQQLLKRRMVETANGKE